jgi:hypothetical protein
MRLVSGGLAGEAASREPSDSAVEAIGPSAAAVAAAVDRWRKSRLVLDMGLCGDCTDIWHRDAQFTSTE